MRASGTHGMASGIRGGFGGLFGGILIIVRIVIVIATRGALGVFGKVVVPTGTWKCLTV